MKFVKQLAPGESKKNAHQVPVCLQRSFPSVLKIPRFSRKELPIFSLLISYSKVHN